MALTNDQTADVLPISDGVGPTVTAIIVVHGVTPQPPYAMQDHCAEVLASELKLRDGLPWNFDIWEPPTEPDSSARFNPLRSITRVYRSRSADASAGTVGSDPEASAIRIGAEDPEGDYYDVIEAYWSPLDKGKTTAARVIAWLLRTIFVPLNTTARYMASGEKKTFDVLYVTGVLFLALVLLLACASGAVLSLAAIVTRVRGNPTTLAEIAKTILSSDVSKLASLLDVRTIAYAAVGFVGAFLLAQAIKAAIWLLKNSSAFGPTLQAQFRQRIYAIATLALVGVVLEVVTVLFPWGQGLSGLVVLLFVVTAGLFALLRTFLQSEIVDFFGDVQIYTTRDQNADFYALRESILSEVTRTIGQTIKARTKDGKRRYDRVIILAHSLGSTVAMDALIRLYTLKEQTKDVDDSISADFASIRAFVTFGTALEKTRYFFDVVRPSLSESALQWENDQYGVLFNSDIAALREPDNAKLGIYWTNYWYLQDPIANEIVSYQSFMVPTDSLSIGTAVRSEVEEATKGLASDQCLVGRRICFNQRGWQKWAPTFSHFSIHSLYLDDPWFWRTAGQTNDAPVSPSERSPASKNVKVPDHVGVLDVVTTKAASSFGVPLRQAFIGGKRAIPEVPNRWRVLPAADVDTMRDRYGNPNPTKP